jgi:hypothetical protein
MQLDHAPLAPSAAARWVFCPGSVSLAAKYPEPETEESREGNAAHWVAAQMLAGHTAKVGEPTPQGVPVDDDMLFGAAIFCAVVLQYTKSPTVEKTITNSAIHPRNFGTPDAFDTPAPYLIEIFDYKYGHELIEVFENWQLINYFALIAVALGINTLCDERVVVRFHIIQPRGFHADGPHRIWEVKASDLRAHINMLKVSAEQSQLADPPTRVGPHCHYCPARRGCRTLQSVTLAMTTVSHAATAFDLPPEGVGAELRLLSFARELIKARIEGLEAEAEAMLRAGKRVPFYTLEPGRGKWVWKKPVKEVLAAGAMLRLNLQKPEEAITPLQARALGWPEELLDDFAQHNPGALKLAAVNSTLAKKVFSHE